MGAGADLTAARARNDREAASCSVASVTGAAGPRGAGAVETT